MREGSLAEGTLAEEVLLDVIKPESNEWGRWAPARADMALRGAEAKLVFGDVLRGDSGRFRDSEQEDKGEEDNAVDGR